VKIRSQLSVAQFYAESVLFTFLGRPSIVGNMKPLPPASGMQGDHIIFGIIK